MAHRKRWIIAYDIRAPDRLKKVHKAVAKRAYALQYSVFVADLTEIGLDRLRHRLETLIKPDEDDVRFYPAPPGVEVSFFGRTRLPEGVMLFGQGAADLAGRRSRVDPDVEVEEQR